MRLKHTKLTLLHKSDSQKREIWLEEELSSYQRYMWSVEKVIRQVSITLVSIEAPNIEPSNQRTNNPSIVTNQRTSDPTNHRTKEPENHRTSDPTIQKTIEPSNQRSNEPTIHRTIDPTKQRSNKPAIHRTSDPTIQKTNEPQSDPSNHRSNDPTKQRSNERWSRGPTIYRSIDLIHLRI